MDENQGSADERVTPLIVLLRGQRVILDRDLARAYGVATAVLNQAVKRNSERFPDDFAFQLKREEMAGLKSQFVTSNQVPPGNQRLTGTSSHSVTISRGGTRKLPWAFTEHGALMAANVLRSQRAVQMSIFVMRAFIRLREQAAANAEILKRLAEIDRTLLQHDAALRDVYRKLQPLLAPPADPAKRRIGF